MIPRITFKILIVQALGLSALLGQAPNSQLVPAPIVQSAVRAVSDLGLKVVQGEFMAPIERMYPTWKVRTAKRMGGTEKLQQLLEDTAREMVRQGMTITQFRPYGTPRAYEVYPGKKVEVINGQKVESLRYTKWLVIVPTITHFNARLADDPVLVKIESKSFQVAIADKGSKEWSFIDGASVQMSDLRSLFITLPETLKLPPLEKRQIK